MIVAVVIWAIRQEKAAREIMDQATGADKPSGHKTKAPRRRARYNRRPEYARETSEDAVSRAHAIEDNHSES